MKFATFVVALMLISFGSAASAWNSEGHMVVAAAAYDLLDGPIKARVAQLLRLNPSTDVWNSRIETAPASQKDKLRFVMAATWPDDIKSDKNYTNDNGQTMAEARQNIGYQRDHFRHRNWHFVDTPFSQDGSSTSSFKMPKVNAQERIDLFRQTLASNAKDSLKSYDLVWLIHLVGDIHQPLHASTRITKQLPDGDHGGNYHCLEPSTSNVKCTGEELHAFWDGAIGGSKSSVKSAEYATNELTAAQPGSMETSKWISDSFELSKSSVYVSPIKASGRGPSKTTQRYATDAESLSKEQIALAAARLAKILNEELK